MENKPIVAITMGDPFGNGPEITVKALHDPKLYEACRPLVVGDASCMEYALEVARKVSGIDLKLHPIQEVKEALFQYGTIDLIDLGLVEPEQIPHNEKDGKPAPFGVGACALGGEAAFQYVIKVIDLAMKKQVDATVTNALSKEAINMAGHHYSGHTEIYAEYTHTEHYTMML
ncbi:4-hydroxythreonine-4-phosphate dehydrogenase PdxA, partial [Acidaminococcus timonensis]